MIASGADLPITATFHNKNLYSFIAHKEIHNPADLRRAANQFSVLYGCREEMFFTLGKRVAASA